MKRWIAVFVLMLTLLSGCSGSEEPVPEMPKEGFDNSGEKTVLYCGKKTFPLSFTVDGKQQIENGTYWYYELEKDFQRDWNTRFYTYGTKKMELNGAKEYRNAVKEKCFATNGDWPLFLNPVHSEYSASNQALADKKLPELLKKYLTVHQLENEKPIITDTWSCDMDGDGNTETFFEACNCEEDTAKYYCMIGYAKGDECQVLYNCFSQEASCRPEKLTPMVCDLNGDGAWSLMIHKVGDYESFSLFDFLDGNFVKNYEVIF